MSEPPIRFDGRGSERRLEPKRACPRCFTAPIYYVGSTVTHGSPFSPAADTEIEHHYECPHCGHEWDVTT